MLTATLQWAGAAIGLRLLEPHLSAQVEAKGLAEIGDRIGLKVGIQCSTGRLSQDKLGPFLRQNFNLVTAPLKWSSLHRSPDVFDFSEADRQFADAKKYGIRIHGHNLCWNASNPEWVTKLSSNDAPRTLAEHIRTVAGRYRGAVDSWDVVNEPVAIWDGRKDALRRGPWLQLIGPEYIELAFSEAQAADPSALRTLNLNGCEAQNKKGEETRRASIQLISDLLRLGVPLQAVALQAHIDAPWRGGDRAYTRFLHALIDSGLEIYISELDVNDTAVPGNDQQVEQAVALSYREYLSDVLSVIPLSRLIFWTISDRYDWYAQMAEQSARWRRADGRRHHPGLTNESFEPTPAYEAVSQTITEYAHRRPERMEAARPL